MNAIKYLSAPETAKLMRADLKKAFPGIKFGVRSEQYSGGQSVNVHWVGGPNSRRVKKITDRYRSATFDGMTDLKESVIHDYMQPDGSIERVHYGNDFGNCTRDFASRADEYTAYHEAALYIVGQCKMEGPAPVDIGQPGQDTPWDWFRALDRWTFGRDYLSTLARAMAFERDYLRDEGWSRAFRAAILREQDAIDFQSSAQMGQQT